MKWVTLNELSNYSSTLALMEQTVDAVINKLQPETTYLLEHQEVYTTGTNYTSSEILNLGNIPIIHTGRGGKCTYHGPGQRVIYPIIDLSTKTRQKDVKLYIKMLEEWIIRSLDIIGVTSFIIPDRVGIWVKYGKSEAKIASIGIRIRKWVTYHGIAVNISTNLARFSRIIPCGINDFPVTSLAELGVDISLKEFDNILKAEFIKVF